MYAVNVLPHKEPVALLCIVEGVPEFGAPVYRKSRRRANMCLVMVEEAPRVVVIGTKWIWEISFTLRQNCLLEKCSLLNLQKCVQDLGLIRALWIHTCNQNRTQSVSYLVCYRLRYPGILVLEFCCFSYGLLKLVYDYTRLGGWFTDGSLIYVYVLSVWFIGSGNGFRHYFAFFFFVNVLSCTFEWGLWPPDSIHWEKCSW